jgi:dienelactone hydrolase
MTLRISLAIALALAATGCDAKQANKASQQAPKPVVIRPVLLKASDGVVVHGTWYDEPDAKAVIVLFHQAESSKDEYATIAPRLAKAGYSALAIDQRSGGALFGKNETAAALGRNVDYLDGRPDMQAALDWARKLQLPIVLWGSSYSSSLIFPLAARDPDGIVGLLAFSPGEYFANKHMIRSAAAKVKVPAFVASTNAKDEVAEADSIMAAVPKGRGNIRFVPAHGVHGSSTLIPARNPEGAKENWKPVLDFLARVTRS